MHIIYEKYAEILGTENGFGEDVIEDIILNIQNRSRNIATNVYSIIKQNMILILR